MLDWQPKGKMPIIYIAVWRTACEGRGLFFCCSFLSPLWLHNTQVWSGKWWWTNWRRNAKQGTGGINCHSVQGEVTQGCWGLEVHCGTVRDKGQGSTTTHPKPFWWRNQWLQGHMRKKPLPQKQKKFPPHGSEWWRQKQAAILSFVESSKMWTQLILWVNHTLWISFSVFRSNLLLCYLVGTPLYQQVLNLNASEGGHGFQKDTARGSPLSKSRLEWSSLDLSKDVLWLT